MNPAVLTAPRTISSAPIATGHPLGGRRAWSVWAVAAAVYLTAFFHRTSLGVASLAAQQRFGVDATALSTFAILQLGVYMAMQIPSGVMADRFGPRRMLGIALLIMALGEALFAFATTMPLAVLGRALVGLGDALTFINVIRLIASWFPRRRFTLLIALTGMTGALGQIVGTAPLSAALRAFGWTPTFLGVGLVSGLLSIVVWWVRDHPGGPMERSIARTSVRADLRAVFAARGTRAGLWTHFATMSSFMVLATLWGYPYLVEGLGMAPGTARLVLTAGAATPMVAAPLIGWLGGRRPDLRGRLIIGVTAVLAVAWLIAITWPGGHLPGPLAGGLVLISAVGSAASMLAFDFARDANPPHRGGIASGLVNVGGFSAAVTGSLSAGMLLDATGGHYNAGAFQVAFLPITAMVVIGAVRVALLLRRAPADGGRGTVSRGRTSPGPAVPRPAAAPSTDRR
ncbi:MFS transporter [Actinoallomurus sp. NPDC050550]|uniref:MFS transporter n=1 Tax=Actinoallomurus sp. NPDC050550 TaxID=3154937 RepID=UPI0033F085C3